MIVANRPKNQHWVPRFYLRNFATPETRTRGKDESQIWMFSNDERDGNERLTNIKNVCTRRYLYSPTDSAGRRDCDVPPSSVADLFRVRR